MKCGANLKECQQASETGASQTKRTQSPDKGLEEVAAGKNKGGTSDTTQNLLCTHSQVYRHKYVNGKIEKHGVCFAVC